MKCAYVAVRRVHMSPTNQHDRYKSDEHLELPPAALHRPYLQHAPPTVPGTLVR